MSGPRRLPNPRAQVASPAFRAALSQLAGLNKATGLNATLAPTRGNWVQEMPGQAYESDAYAIQRGPMAGMIYMNPKAIQSRTTLGHELGHIAQHKYVPNREAADRYVDIAHGVGARGFYWLKDSQQGRSELGVTRPTMPRDHWGMPTLGPHGLHTNMVEQYANDFGASLGGANDPRLQNRTTSSLRKGDVWSHASPDRMARLRAAGLVAKQPYAGWIGPQGPRGPQRLTHAARARDMYLATLAPSQGKLGPMGPDNLALRVDSLPDPRRSLGISQKQAERLFGLREDLDYKYGG